MNLLTLVSLHLLGCQEQSLLLQLCHLQTNKCLVAQSRPSQKGSLVVLKACDYGDPNQVSDASELTASPWKVSFSEGELPAAAPEKRGVNITILIWLFLNYMV